MLCMNMCVLAVLAVLAAFTVPAFPAIACGARIVAPGADRWRSQGPVQGPGPPPADAVRRWARHPPILCAAQPLRGGGDGEPAPHRRGARRDDDDPAGPKPPLQGNSGRRGRRWAGREEQPGGEAGAASERAMDLLPAELRVQGGERVDEWGRHRPPHLSTQAPPAASLADGAGEGGVQTGGRGRRKRHMITFDLALLYPKCAGWNINFTCPMDPTQAELDAASKAQILKNALRVDLG